ncbi:hypothetical protein NUW54_g9443 [Trametes sanguinea]|uniref:Uncharacterized protein n=1 Tax=Trametes sanguinea TaxID=158606 RepID=A0ACC1P7K9_9APHY|nr:hypothetical protein NUW54_g9443 [Trametes sanguinea]
MAAAKLRCLALPVHQQRDPPPTIPTYARPLAPPKSDPVEQSIVSIGEPARPHEPYVHALSHPEAPFSMNSSLATLRPLPNTLYPPFRCPRFRTMWMTAAYGVISYGLLDVLTEIPLTIYYPSMVSLPLPTRCTLRMLELTDSRISAHSPHLHARWTTTRILKLLGIDPYSPPPSLLRPSFSTVVVRKSKISSIT